MAINAKTNMNGNSPESFRKYGKNIMNAAVNLQAEMREAGEVFHGRNYQMYEDGNAMREVDVERYGKMLKALEDYKALAVEIYMAGDAR